MILTFLQLICIILQQSDLCSLYNCSVLTMPLYVPLASARVHIEPPLLLHSRHFQQTKDSSLSGSYNVSACDTCDVSISNRCEIPQKLLLISLESFTHCCISVL